MPRPGTRARRPAAPRSRVARRPRRVPPRRARKRRTRWTRTARPCRREGARARRPPRSAVSRPAAVPANPRLRARGCGSRYAPARELDGVLDVPECAKDEDVLGPVDPGAVCNRGPPPGEITLDGGPAPAVEPLCCILAVRLNERVGDRVDEVGVRGHVPLQCEALHRVTLMPLSEPIGSPRVLPTRLLMAAHRPHGASWQTKAFRSRRRQSGTEERDGNVGPTHDAADGTSRRTSGPAKRTPERDWARLLGYDPHYCGDGGGFIGEQAVPTTWRGIDDRSGRPCAAVGTGLVSECLRRAICCAPRGGDDGRHKPNRNNDLHALD